MVTLNGEIYFKKDANLPIIWYSFHMQALCIPKIIPPCNCSISIFLNSILEVPNVATSKTNYSTIRHKFIYLIVILLSMCPCNMIFKLCVISRLWNFYDEKWIYTPHKNDEKLVGQTTKISRWHLIDLAPNWLRTKLTRRLIDRTKLTRT